MKCPFCGADESNVLDSRRAEDRIKRRRECCECHRRFTTFESVEYVPLIVVKNDMSRQPFDREKLLRSMLIACTKRPIASGVLEQAVTDIESTLRNNMTREITSARLGEMALEKLLNIDAVAYIRFACVYRQFKDVKSFIAELQQLTEQ